MGKKKLNKIYGYNQQGMMYPQYTNPVTGQMLYQTQAPVSQAIPVGGTAPIYQGPPQVPLSSLQNKFYQYRQNKKFCGRCKVEYKIIKNSNKFKFGKIMKLKIQRAFYSHRCGVFN